MSETQFKGIYYSISDKGKLAKNEWESDDSDFLWALYSVCQKLGQSFFHTSP